MKYMLLMYAEDGVWPEEDHRHAVEESIGFCHELHAKGQYVRAAPLHPPATAKRVAIRTGQQAVLDGPFAESKECLGGFFLIDVATREEAVAAAARLPGARRGTAEVRPLVELPVDLSSFPSAADATSGERGIQYMLLIHTAEDAWTESEWRSCVEESIGLCQELERKGQLLGASPLQPVRTATSVRVRSGTRLITDGPYAETKEHLGGYFLIRVPGLDDAIAIAARLPGAKKGSVEIRPVIELPDLPR